ncbi:metal transporter [Desulfomonile tiedjei]|nr:metal transporter [Desulfomonile tiedjei]
MEKLNSGRVSNPASYASLVKMSTDRAMAAWEAVMEKAWAYHTKELFRYLSLSLGINGNGNAVNAYYSELMQALRTEVIDMPAAVKDIRREYGFHLESDAYVKVAETERMELYQVLPNARGVKVDPSMKPVMIAHPYVLGPNILAFLPGEGKSYVHSFANQGIPTYVRIIKNIDENPAVQTMTGEDDALDTRYFARILVKRHGKPVTLNGVCQAGFIFLADILTGRLDGLVDALITAASPADGTRSPGLKGFLNEIPRDFRTLGYSLKTLPNGNKVVDGQVMSWVYKLKSIESEFPLVSFYRDLDTFQEKIRKGIKLISKTTAAVGHWLLYDRTDLPLAITELSKISYSKPISRSGDLPFELFGQKLNLHSLTEKNIKLLICYGRDDKLVEPPSALAPLDYIPGEKTEFPKGHAAMFTSWSDPKSEYALHKRFQNGQRGPVRFHLDLDKEMSHSSPHEKVA